MDWLLCGLGCRLLTWATLRHAVSGISLYYNMWPQGPSKNLCMSAEQQVSVKYVDTEGAEQAGQFIPHKGTAWLWDP